MKRVSENPHKNNIVTPDEYYAYETGKQVQLNADKKVIREIFEEIGVNAIVRRPFDSPYIMVLDYKWYQYLKDKYLK